MNPSPRERSLGELAEDLDTFGDRLDKLDAAVRAGNDAIMGRLDSLPFVRTDVYEARHAALRSEIELRIARLDADQASTKAIAAGARTTAMWGVALIAVPIIGTIVALVSRGFA